MNVNSVKKIVNEIFDMYEQVKKTQETSSLINYLDELVQIVSQHLESAQNMKLLQGDEEEYKNIEQALLECLQFMEKYSKLDFFSYLNNVVHARELYDELQLIERGIFKFLAALDQKKPKTMIFVKIFESLSENKKITPEKLQMIRQITSEALSENVVVEEMVKSQDPLGFNPYFDAICYGTSIGKALNADQKERLRQFIHDSDSISAAAIFEKDKEKMDQELRQYFKQYYGTKNTNLKTVIKQAINQAIDGTITKYFDQPASYFIGKRFKLNLPTTDPLCAGDGKCLASILGDITEASYSTLDTLRSLKLKVQGTSSNTLYSFLIQQDSSQQRNLKIKFETTSSQISLLRQLRYSPLLPGKQFRVQLQLKDDRHTTFPLHLNENLMMSVVPQDRIDSKLSFVTESTGNVIDIFLKADEIEIQVSRHGHLMYSNVYAAHALDSVQLVLFDGKRYEIELPEDKVQIKAKILTKTELRWSKVDEYDRLHELMLNGLSKPNLEPLVNLGLNYLAERNFSLLTNDTFLEHKFIGEFPFDYQILWKKLFSLHHEIHEDDNNRLSDSKLVQQILIEDNFHHFLKSLDDYYPSVSMMERLAVATEYLKNMLNKDITFVIGDTGVGKSTAVNYFIEIPLYSDTFDLNKIKIQQGYQDDKEEYAHIGPSRTRSETVYLRCYNYQHRDNTMICDSPGFRDSRGKGYELTAALSKARAINLSRSVLGVILVIPESAFDTASGRGMEINENFERLEDMFKLPSSDVDPSNELLSILTPEERSRIKIVISHCRDPAQTKKKLETVIAENLEEYETKTEGKNRFEKRKQIWQMIKNMFDNNDILPMDIEDFTGQDWFKERFASTNNQKLSISKERFSNPFHLNSFYLEFSHTISASVQIWDSFIIQKFIELHESNRNLIDHLLPQKKQEVIDLLASIESYRNQINDIDKVIIASRNLLEILQNRKELLDRGEIKPGKSIPKELQKELHSHQSKDLKMSLERKHLLIKEINDLRTKINETNLSLSQLQDDFLRKEKSLTLLREDKLRRSFGSTNITLAQYGPFAPDQIMTEGIVQGSVAQTSRNEVRNPTNEEISSFTNDLAGQRNTRVKILEYVKKGYRIVPMEKYEEFVSQSIVSKNSKGNEDYLIYFEGENAVIDTIEHRPNAHVDGNRVVYFVIVTWVAENSTIEPWKSPWYRLIHRIPNSDLYAQDIKNIDSDITNINQRLLELTKSIDDTDLSLQQYNETLANRLQLQEENNNKCDRLQLSQENIVIEDLLKEYNLKITENTKMIDDLTIEIERKFHSFNQLMSESFELKKKYHLEMIELMKLSIVVQEQFHLASTWRDILYEAVRSSREPSSFLSSTASNQSDFSIAVQQIQQLQGGKVNLLQRCESFIDLFDRHHLLMKSLSSFILQNENLKYHLLSVDHLQKHQSEPSLALDNTTIALDIDALLNRTIDQVASNAMLWNSSYSYQEEIENGLIAFDHSFDYQRSIVPSNMNESGKCIDIKGPNEDSPAGRNQEMWRDFLISERLAPIVEKVLLNDWNQLSLFFTLTSSTKIYEHFPVYRSSRHLKKLVKAGLERKRSVAMRGEEYRILLNSLGLKKAGTSISLFDALINPSSIAPSTASSFLSTWIQAFLNHTITADNVFLQMNEDQRIDYFHKKLLQTMNLKDFLFHSFATLSSKNIVIIPAIQGNNYELTPSPRFYFPLLSMPLSNPSDMRDRSSEVGLTRQESSTVYFLEFAAGDPFSYVLLEENQSSLNPSQQMNLLYHEAFCRHLQADSDSIRKTIADFYFINGDENNSGGIIPSYCEDISPSQAPRLFNQFNSSINSIPAESRLPPSGNDNISYDSLSKFDLSQTRPFISDAPSLHTPPIGVTTDSSPISTVARNIQQIRPACQFSSLLIMSGLIILAVIFILLKWKVFKTLYSSVMGENRNKEGKERNLNKVVNILRVISVKVERQESTQLEDFQDAITGLHSSIEQAENDDILQVEFAQNEAKEEAEAVAEKIHFQNVDNLDDQEDIGTESNDDESHKDDDIDSVHNKDEDIVDDIDGEESDDQSSCSSSGDSSDDSDNSEDSTDSDDVGEEGREHRDAGNYRAIKVIIKVIKGICDMLL